MVHCHWALCLEHWALIKAPRVVGDRAVHDGEDGLDRSDFVLHAQQPTVTTREGRLVLGVSSAVTVYDKFKFGKISQTATA
jgi:hypothetical protein